jgi:type III secretion protein W
MNQTRSISGALPQAGQFSGSSPLAGGGSASIAGRKVVEQQPGEQNVLLGAASELTQAFAARMQQRGMKERTILTGGALAGLSKEIRLKTLDNTRQGKVRSSRAEEGKDGAREQSTKAVDELARAILKNPDRIRQLTEEADGDPTAQFLLLLEAADSIEASGEGGEAVSSAVREVIEELFAERGDRVLADINTVDAYSKLSPEQARRFRTVYHDAAIGAETLGGVLNHIVGLVNESDSGASFTEMHRSMISALGMDIAAVRPSTDRAKLQALVSDLYHLEVIGTTLEGCDALAGKIEQRHGVSRFPSQQLTTDLIGLAGERWVDADHFKRLADRYKAMEPPAAMVDFLTGARDLIKELPVKIFSTPENRQSLIDAAQDAVDYSIDREEGIVS